MRQINRMSSLLATTFVLLALSVVLSQTAAEARNSAPTRMNSRDRDRYPRKAKPSRMTCDRYASCALGVENSDTCFCDRVCRLYGDCCSDYVDDDGAPLTPLPSRVFSCIWMSFRLLYVITDCPATYDVQFVRDGCRLGSSSPRHPPNETFYVVPVSSRTSGLVYRNVYCAMCHGEDSAGFWEVSNPGTCHLPHNSEPESTDAGNSDEHQQESFVEGCVFTFSPAPELPEPRRCVNSVDSCPHDADAEQASRCTQSSNVAYVYHKVSHQAYRNHDCAACHRISDYRLTCNSTQDQDRTPPGLDTFESFSIVLDLNTGKGSTVRTFSGGSQTQTLGSCPDRHVFDPFAGTCRAIVCPPGNLFTEDGRCRRRTDIDDDYDQHGQSKSGGGGGYRVQTTTTNTADDVDCVWIQLYPSEYRRLFNKSIYVPLHDATYDADAYIRGDNQTVYICTPFQRNYTQWDQEALRVDTVGTYLSVICSVISLLALAFQFAVYMAFPVLRNAPGCCVICLVVSLFVGQLLFLLVKTGSSVSPGFCFGQATLMHFAFMAAFFWMNVMAFDVYRTFGGSPTAAGSSSSQTGARRRFARYSAYAWVSAAAVVAVGVAIDLADVGGAYRPRYGHRICWFGSRGGLLVLFGVPVGALLVVNIVMFALSVRQIRNASKASQMAVQNTDQTQLLVSSLHLIL